MTLTPLEQACLQAFRAGEFPQVASAISDEVMLRHGFGILLRIAQLVRGNRLTAGSIKINHKEDGSPVTQLELDIENTVRESLSLLPEGAVLISEEAGGVLPDSGTALALDPIDGTRSFLAQTESFATSLAYFKDGFPRAGLVMNPSTGELGYAVDGKQSRLVQISVFGEADMSCALPTADQRSSLPVLVHVHPTRNAAALVNCLYDMWQSDGVEVVRSTGGSPAFFLLEAAKGHFIYVNLWERKPAAAFDLAAGILLVRGAGGEVFDNHGKPVSPMGHQGPFFAGIWNEERYSILQRLIEQVRRGSST